MDVSKARGQDAEALRYSRAKKKRGVKYHTDSLSALPSSINFYLAAKDLLTF